MSADYAVGDLVWAKMKGFPFWPGKISDPPADLKRSSLKKGSRCIYFFGSKNYAYVEESSLKPYSEYKDALIKSNKTTTFKEAVDAIETYIHTKDETLLFAEKGEILFEKIKNSMPDDEKPKKKSIKRSTAADSNESNDTKKSLSNSNHVDGQKTPLKKKRSNVSNASAEDKIRSTNSSQILATTPHKRGLLDRPTGCLSQEEPMPLDVTNITQTLQDKKIEPSNLKFGFIGLGNMGSGMVRNLINSGHVVTIWNRTTDKCEKFVKCGARNVETPGDVIDESDIIFCCVSGPAAARDMMFGNCGALSQITPDKSYVEMTGIDAETSRDIAEAVAEKGGRYLEAQIQGSKTDAEEGTLVILAGGDKSLFDDCQSSFVAMSKHSFFLGKKAIIEQYLGGDKSLFDDCQSSFVAMSKHSFFLGEVGNASKMNLVLQMIYGISLAGLAEGMAVADRAGLSQKDVLEIMSLTSMSSPVMLEKGDAMIKGLFPPSLALQHLQKDVKLALVLGDQVDQPLPLTATANEIYKHAKRLGYSEHDAASVYIRARF